MYQKGLHTLCYLMSLLGKETIFDRIEQKYQPINVQNTIKILIRCRIIYSSIGIWEKIMSAVNLRDLKSK